MTQHDFNIANQTFPSFRSDLNNALEAGVTLSSGSAAPTTTFANQWWIDSTNSLLKRRDTANTLWLTIARLDNSLDLSTYSGDPNSNVTPIAKGELLFDTTNDLFYYAKGTANTDWMLLTSYSTGYHDVKIDYTSASTITILEGSKVRSSDDTTNIYCSSDITVDLSASGAGGLDTGAEAADTWYYIYLIWNPTTATISAVASTVDESVTGSITFPSDYTKKRQLKIAIRNDSGSDILPFQYSQNDFIQYVDIDTSADLVVSSGTATSATDIDCSGYMPPCSELGYFYARGFNGGSTSREIYIKQKGSSGIYRVAASLSDVNGKHSMLYLYCPTDSSQVIQYAVEGTSASLDIAVIGFKVTEIF